MVTVTGMTSPLVKTDQESKGKEQKCGGPADAVLGFVSLISGSLSSVSFAGPFEAALYNWGDAARSLRKKWNLAAWSTR